MKSRPSDERIREVLSYDHQTGKFSRNDKYGSRDQPGSLHRYKNRNLVYQRIGIDGRQMFSHQLAWLFIHGEWPSGFEIDHINGDGLDNRACNLRRATRAENSTNAPAQKSNRVGLRGVHFHAEAKRYRAQITKSGKTKSLGYFDTPEEAHAAYLAAAKKIHGEFVRSP